MYRENSDNEFKDCDEKGAGYDKLLPIQDATYHTAMSIALNLYQLENLNYTIADEMRIQLAELNLKIVTFVHNLKKNN